MNSYLVFTNHGKSRSLLERQHRRHRCFEIGYLDDSVLCTFITSLVTRVALTWMLLITVSLGRLELVSYSIVSLASTSRCQDSRRCMPVVFQSVAAGTPSQLGGEGCEDSPEGEAGGVDRSACSGLQQDPGAGDTGTGHSPRDDAMNRLSSMDADDQQALSKSVAMATVSPSSLPTLLCSVQERHVMCVSTPAPQEPFRPCQVSTTALPPVSAESLSPVQSCNKEENTPMSVSTTLWSTISTQPDLINSSASGMNRGSLTATSPATARAETRLDIQKISSHNQGPPSPPTKGPVPVNVAIIDPDCNAVKREGSAGCLEVGLDVTQDLGRPQGPQPLAQVAYTAAGQAVGFHSLRAYASVQCATHPSPSPARSVGNSHLDSPQNPVQQQQQQQVLSDTPHVSRCQAESATNSRSLAQCEASAACCSLCSQTLHVHSPSVHVYNLPAHARSHGSGRPVAAAAALQCPTFSTHLSHHYQHLHAATPQPLLLPHGHHSSPQRFSVARPREEHCGPAAAACGPRPAPLQQYLHPDLFPAVAADVLACGSCHACRGSAHESPSDGLRTRLTDRGLPADAVQQAVILWRPPRTGGASSAGSVAADHGYPPVVYPQPLLTGEHLLDALRGSALPPSSPSFFLHHQHPATAQFPPSAATDLYLDGYISYPSALGETFSSHAPYVVFRDGSPQFFRY